MDSHLLSFSNPKGIFPPLPQHLLNRYYNKTKPNLLFQHKPINISSLNTKKLLKCSSISNLSTPRLDEPLVFDHRGKEEEEEEEEVEEGGGGGEEKELREMWKEIQGCNDWEGLLDPINCDLREEIIRYGEFAQACYDSFDFDPHSKYCGTCKYSAAQFFKKLDMADYGYQISRYLYATSNINLPNFFQKSKLSSVWSTYANWMGYIAVTTDEEEIKRLGRRDIVVSWRGTVTYIEWISDLKDILHPTNFSNDPSIKIELGFHDLYTKKEESCNYCTFSAREQVLAEIKRLLEYYEGEEISITFTGHSLGAALAIVSAYDVAELGLNVINDGESSTRVPITVYSFAGPRVGNLKFKERCDELGVKVLRVVNVHDKVPTVPGILANEKFQFQKYLEEATHFPWSYAHVGVELALDHTQSPFLKNTKDFGCAHNLEALLHLLDGYCGKEKQFCLETIKRDIALVNKSCNFLKSEYGVPPHWRQDENKGMVRNSDGRWVLPERPILEALPEDTAHHLEKVLKNANNNANAIADDSSQLEAI